MILRLEMPFLDSSVERARIERWAVGPGDEVGYGDPLFEVVVEEVVRVGGIIRADRLNAAMEEGGGTVSGGTRRTVSAQFRAAVISSDVGWVRRVEAPAGSTLGIGELAAIVSTEAEETLEGEARSTFRVVADVGGDEEDL